MKRILALAISVWMMAAASWPVTKASGQTVADGNGVGYSTLSQALAETGSGYLQLLQDTAEDVTVEKNITLDLNGHSISGAVTVVEGYTLYGMDSRTDDYTVMDEDGYGTIAEKTGDGVLAGLPEASELAEDGYLMVTEPDGISFHRVNLRITAMTLRATECGIYYKSAFAGDEKVASAVKSFGVALNAKGVPEVFNMGITSSYSVFTNFAPGPQGNGNRCSTLLKNILKPNNAPLKNNVNATYKIYGRAYILTEEGYVFGKSVSRSLKEQMEAVDPLWGGLKDSQKAPILTLYRTYTSLMKSWNIPNIKENGAL